MIRRLCLNVVLVACGVLACAQAAGAQTTSTTTPNQCDTATSLSVSDYAVCSTAHDVDNMRSEVATGMFLVVFLAAAGVGLMATRGS